ncbi:MAG: tRNA (adenosine(37)-N6)-dimethylallyltransferase MiaA [Bacteroidales bacterium]
MSNACAKKLIIVLGPTAVGKSDYAINLALKYGSPVVSCDSRQIFKEMSIGTAVPSEEQLLKVKHYFIHSHTVAQYYTAGKYEIEALALLEELFRSHDTIVMAGGSGLYIDALCNGLDDFPEADQTIRSQLMERLDKEGIESLQAELLKVDPETYYSVDIANRQRVVRALEVTIATGHKFSSYKTNPAKQRGFEIEKTGLTRDRDELYERINKRVDLMIEAGLEDEVRSLVQYREMPALKTVGYREMFEYFDGVVSREEAINLIKRNTRHYAKRQMTYWGRDNTIQWLSCPTQTGI